MNYRVRSIVFAAGWLCLPLRENWFVDSGVGQAFTSGKDNGVNPQSVSCNCPLTEIDKQTDYVIRTKSHANF